MFPWHHRWTVLAFTLLSQAMAPGLYVFSFSFWVVPWLDEFKVPRSQVMLIATVGLLACAFVAPACGIALDKFRIRWVISFGAIAFAAGLALVSMARSHWEIMLLYGTLLAIGNMLCGQLGSQVLVTRWFRGNRGIALGISALGVSLGALVMPPIATGLLAAFGWREAFRWLALFGLLVIVPTTWLVLGPQPEKLETTPDTAHQSRDSITWPTTQLVRDRDFWIIVLGFFALIMASNPVIYGLGVYAHDLGLTQRRAALIASTGAIAMAAGKFSFGKLADVVEHRHLYWYAAGGMLLSILGAIMARSWSALPTLTTAFSGVCFCFGAYVPLFASFVIARFGAASFGRVMGLATNFVLLGALSPFLAGLLEEVSGSYTLAFILLASPLLLAMFAMCWLSSSLQRTAITNLPIDTPATTELRTRS